MGQGLDRLGTRSRNANSLSLVPKYALLRGRYHVTVDGVEALAHPVLRHRIVPTFNAEAEGISVEHLIDRLLEDAPKKKA